MTEPIDTGLAQVQRDALASAHTLGYYPMAWNERLRQTLVDRGLVEYVEGPIAWRGYRLTEAGTALARRIRCAAYSPDGSS